jgi:hypothetical protein
VQEDDFEKTSMRDAIGTFRTAFLEPLLVEVRRPRRCEAPH